MAPSDTATEGGGTPDWRRAEEEYTDEVIGDDTLSRMFEASTRRHTDGVAQRYKGGIYDRSLVAEGVVPAAPDGAYADLTYGEMGDIVGSLAAGFRELGLEPGERVGIFADTRMEWAHADLALLAAGAVVTTVYTESSPRKVRYLLDDPGATGVIVENEQLLERVLQVEDELDLEFIVLLDDHDGYGDREDVLTLGELHERGREAFDQKRYESWLDDRDPSELASLIYTSGTTGKPKGVRLTHANLRSNVNQIRKRTGPRPDKGDLPSITPGTVLLSFLPLAHVFERTVGHFFAFASGATVAYAESADTVGEDIKAVKPSTVTSVPRVYERVYDGMREQASDSDFSQRVFDWAVGVARDYARSDDPGMGLRAKHALADRLVYSTVREQMGDNIDFFVSGGGTLSKDLQELFYGMGLTIAEGYGLTEAAPVVTTNPIEDIRPGTLGPPLVDIEFRLDDGGIGESVRRRATGEVGELLIKGPNITDGYWNKPDETEAAFTEDGYFRTGDVVERTTDDYLVFHERRKQILVLSTGKNVAPGPIEEAFVTSERVEQVVVIGDERKFISALIVPSIDEVRAWGRGQGLDLPEDDAALCRDERVRAWVGDAVEEVNRGFEAEEQIKKFELVPEEWTAENGLLTPSMKKKRRDILDRYEGEVAAIYAEETVPADD
jgi:long-chain acyl-CoA synthetase